MARRIVREQQYATGMASHHKSIIVFELEKRLPRYKICKNIIFDSQSLAESGMF